MKGKGKPGDNAEVRVEIRAVCGFFVKMLSNNKAAKPANLAIFESLLTMKLNERYSCNSPTPPGITLSHSISNPLGST